MVERTRKEGEEEERALGLVRERGRESFLFTSSWRGVKEVV